MVFAPRHIKNAEKLKPKKAFLVNDFIHSYRQIYNNSLGNLSGSIFYDYGKITQYKEVGTTNVRNNNYSLSGYGVSLDLVSANLFSSKLVWAHTNGSNPGASTLGLDSDGKKNQNRFWILANINF
jgi:hypothetical protein